ncbi:hypothetical protein MIND_01112700 [Mycena indigotica]|uniref:ABM domain-containing protein n=1 Tax=Mycena indigotica TaxID=2126181 RepID=A0A8H6SBI8_9AGAR|nr:uncharacterized protein MIND_01112700 [Mycena indigotica]KAF7295721.1 hypothetical protein MIND_01112700 [Mycena indigotica]
METRSPRTSPPYYAVIFTSTRAARPDDGYAEMADRMVQLAKAQPGFLGLEHAGETAAASIVSGITVSYWADEESIRAWKHNFEHLLAQKRGKTDWYLAYDVRVARVERAYSFDANGDTVA